MKLSEILYNLAKEAQSTHNLEKLAEHYKREIENINPWFDARNTLPPKSSPNLDFSIYVIIQDFDNNVDFDRYDYYMDIFEVYDKQVKYWRHLPEPKIDENEQ